MRVRTRIAGGLLLLMPMGVRAQDYPVELDVQRQPTISTKGSCFLKGATILTVTQGTILNGNILVRDGKIVAFGKDVMAPAGVTVIDATGKFITPGLVDAHSHIAADSINEGTDSITADVRIHDVLNPQSVSIYRGLSSGVTASLILHGSANAIGGQSVVVKMKYKKTAEEMIIPDAPRMIKFALGENVTRRGRSSDFPGQDRTPRFPGSRMGVETVYRRAFNEAQKYIAKWDAWEKTKQSDPNAVPPRRDLRLEALADILRGKIRVQCHSYRSDEMLLMVRLSQEFKFRLVLQHALEAFKITPEIVAANVGVSTFAGDWAYKLEAFDAIPYNAALCLKAGIVTSVNSDNGGGTYRLNLEAAKCIRYGGLSETEALKLVTLNPAIQLGIEKRAGSIETGKDADLAIWEGHPLSNYSRCVLTLVEGDVAFQRKDAFGVDKAATVKNTILAEHTDPLSLPPLKAANMYAIVGATVHPVSGPDIPGGTVLISDGKIKAVGKNIPIPSGAVVVNAKGLHVYPGLIDAGSQIGLNEIGQVNVSDDTSENGSFQPDLKAIVAVNPSSEHILVTRIAGITTTQTAPSGGGGGFGGGDSIVFGQSAIIGLAGWTAEQMQLNPVYALHINLPEGPDEELLEQLKEFLPAEDIQRRREQEGVGTKRLTEFLAQVKQYAKARTEGGDSVPLNLQFEAMRPYLAGQKPVVLHASTPKSIRAAVQFAEDNKLKMILADGGEAWRVAELLAKKNIPVLYSVPLSNSLGGASFKEYDPYDTPFASVSVLLKAGVKVAFQSSDAASSRNLPAQVGLCCAYGTPPAVALKALTLGAAEILGIANVTGSLDAGKRADLIITDGDPLEITTAVQRMFIAGKPVPLESKHTRFYQLYRQRLAELKSPVVQRAAK